MVEHWSGANENLLRSLMLVFLKLTPATKKCCGCTMQSTRSLRYAHLIIEDAFWLQVFLFFRRGNIMSTPSQVSRLAINVGFLAGARPCTPTKCIFTGASHRLPTDPVT